MPFVKLDCGILDSTLWVNRDCREVFITALLMAEPQEFLEPVKQIEVDTLGFTGWAAPAGWYGFVPAAGIGIVRRAGIEQEAGLVALRRLSSPETESRNPEHEGRRLIRMNGGYIILNYMRYRDRDYTGAERSKRYRERIKQRSNGTTSHRDTSSSHRDITQAESEADIYKEKIKSAAARAIPTGSLAAQPIQEVLQRMKAKIQQ